jgi:hypothetical protein
MAPVWPHGDKQVTMLGALTAPSPVKADSRAAVAQKRQP